nr:AraC family transcriptional regulator [Pedobacter panaciterrae]
MKLNITSSGDDSFLANIANLIGSKVENGTIRIPDQLGSGSISGYIINPNIRIMIRQYELKEDLNFKVSTARQNKEAVMIAFHNVFKLKDQVANSLTQSSANMVLLPYVQVASAGIDTEFFIPANTRMNSIIIGVHVEYLKELLQASKDNILLQAITSTNQPYLFEEIISPEIQNVAQQIVTANVATELKQFYFKIKAEELIYLLFVELLKREDKTVQSLNIADVKALYLVKEKILSTIDVPPNLSELAVFSGMSESKLNRLFNQIFGTSIYQYYQVFRMKEAAYLLNEGKLSVSEVGYRLGFSNLSHFTKLFETHTGVKPKKFKMR